VVRERVWTHIIQIRLIYWLYLRDSVAAHHHSHQVRKLQSRRMYVQRVSSLRKQYKKKKTSFITAAANYRQSEKSIHIYSFIMESICWHITVGGEEAWLKCVRRNYTLFQFEGFTDQHIKKRAGNKCLQTWINWSNIIKDCQNIDYVIQKMINLLLQQKMVLQANEFCTYFFTHCVFFFVK